MKILGGVVVLLAVIASTTAVGAQGDPRAAHDRALLERAERTSFQSAPHWQSTTICNDDVTGDAGDPRSDITRLCTDYISNGLWFEVAIDEPTNPSTWSGITGGIHHIDVDNNLEDDYLAFHGNSASGYTWRVRDDDTFDVVCEGSAIYSSPYYRLTVPLGCIENSTSVNYYTFFTYDDPTDANFGDFAPDEGQEPYDPNPDPPPSPPSPGMRETSRLAGADRFATAVAISQAQFPNGADIVYLARADAFPDALAGGTLTNGPILLVHQCDTVPQVVMNEITRLNPRSVVALGGSAAVCDAVLSQAATLPT